MSQNKALSFLTVVFFLGILLSVTIYLGFHGEIFSAGERGDRELAYNEAYREDKAVQTFIRYCDYKLFRHIDGGDMIIGRSDWIFEVKREDNGYDYLLDYLGGCPYSEEQLARIASRISQRREACAERGAEYLLVVIPNSMTAASDFLPAHIGGQSEDARLQMLERYLVARDETALLSMGGAMQTISAESARYNNTEDSINSYGAYTIYRAVMGALADRGREAESDLMNVEAIQFFTHYTDGKGAAKKVGLERLISNRTVSLSETMTDRYRISEVTEQCVSTTMTEGATGSAERVVIECSTEWDKIQLMPFFSNTFGTVIYENRIDDGISSLDYHRGTVLIQVIHESELSMLLN